MFEICSFITELEVVKFLRKQATFPRIYFQIINMGDSELRMLKHVHLDSSLVIVIKNLEL